MIMKTKLNIYLFAAGLFLFSSCSDFLEKESNLQQTNEITLSTFDGLNKATVAAYGTFYSSNWYGQNFIVCTDLRGGNAKHAKWVDTGRFHTDYFWANTSSSGAFAAVWGSAYAAIARANNVINTIDGGFSELDITTQDLNNVKAECLFIRALSHFDLVRVFAQPYSYKKDGLGVPVVLVTANAKPARDITSTVYQQIVDDLTEAEKIIGKNYTRSGGKDVTAFANIEAIQALLARVYLYMENWQGAADYSTKVINSGKYNMYKESEYLTVWSLDAAKEGGEVIFQVYGARGNTGWGNWDVIPWITNPNGYGDVSTSHDLINLFAENDIRGKLFITKDGNADDVWTLKYSGKGSGDSKDKQVSNTPILRLSEMYLIRAESLLHGATITGVTALGDYNTILTNRGLSATATVSLSDIMVERRKELNFEGHNAFDLARTQTGLARTDYDGTINQNVPFPDNKWALPIPQTEIDANANIEQNPS